MGRKGNTVNKNVCVFVGGEVRAVAKTGGIGLLINFLIGSETKLVEDVFLNKHRV